jgi:hypothetical protein
MRSEMKLPIQSIKPIVHFESLIVLLDFLFFLNCSAILLLYKNIYHCIYSYSIRYSLDFEQIRTTEYSRTIFRR